WHLRGGQEMHTLTHHRDIQSWVNSNRGRPAIRRVPNSYGRMEARLALAFASHEPSRKFGMTPVDDGLSPCSWTAWLAELDRQRLALRVSDARTDYELVERKDFN